MSTKQKLKSIAGLWRRGGENEPYFSGNVYGDEPIVLNPGDELKIFPSRSPSEKSKWYLKVVSNKNDS